MQCHGSQQYLSATDVCQAKEFSVFLKAQFRRNSLKKRSPHKS